MKLGTWLLAMMQPLIARILTSLGFAVVSITGMESILGQIKQQFLAQMQTLPGTMLDLFLYSGGGVGLGIILGALATKLMLWQIQSSVKILGVNPQ